ncbi:GTPase Era [Enterobacteriaceae endosymbiont of Donacia tomentosa]|uniref:GTPase Era n=1 Tax=Enterobacteriaceae endosymbiont of Donacia tomentosa TaxID=2675787 RepID=UPI0014578545|nr:GTPase Era [Enterobacteriaceae endosymbiont of Donacia tomentosa]
MERKNSYYGCVLILGRSNVGKSTLLNTLIGEKISITSHKINTTYCNITGIYNYKSYQIKYIDTPGIIYNQSHIHNVLYHNKLNYVLFILDRNKWGYAEKKIIKILNNINIPIIIIINKIDKISDKKILLPHIDFLQKKIKFVYLFIISAKYKLHTNIINNFICNNLLKSKHHYPDNIITDQTKEFFVKEIIRENIMKYIHKEIPYLIKITVDSFIIEEINKQKEIKIFLFVKTLNQKKILIGKNAKIIKLITHKSKKNIEEILKKIVNLKLWVKVQ